MKRGPARPAEICLSHHAQFNAETNAWLTMEEEEGVVGYCLALAKRGFPLNHKHLKFHVDALFDGVGKNWTDHFVGRHSAQLGHYWSSSLDTACGRAVNPNTNVEWYKLLEETLEEKNIEPDCIWAADESGFQPGEGLKECVFGPAGRSNQYQQCDGNHENITVMVTKSL
ncbi:hypothetical protein F4604DRAFT_1680054 [Suillus subluteus]|nr:hypothetical protein F4604DRAFT_1680054 [Suillus subluteus]